MKELTLDENQIGFNFENYTLWKIYQDYGSSRVFSKYEDKILVLKIPLKCKDGFNAWFSKQFRFNRVQTLAYLKTLEQKGILKISKGEIIIHIPKKVLQYEKYSSR